METIEIASWSSWKEEIAKLQTNELSRSNEAYYFSDLLFRGHKCASWKLDSTLERKSSLLPSIEEYTYRVVKPTKAAFESLTDRIWDSNFESKDYPAPPEDYEFLVYLRHHGFPTPILDWSRSPYVASFFAFQEKSPEESIAIYTYREFNGGTKGGRVGPPTIVSCGPTIRTHKRHYSQQAEYTYCKEKISDRWHYSNHEKAFSVSKANQDVRVKYILPSCIREKALADLDAMNINAYSLYGSEEGLSKMLTNRIYGYDS